MGPWKETKFGFKYLFTATDFFTKWVEAFPLREKTALEVAQCLLKLFYRYGATKSVLHDNGREFVNKVNRISFFPSSWIFFSFSIHVTFNLTLTFSITANKRYEHIQFNMVISNHKKVE